MRTIKLTKVTSKGLGIPGNNNVLLVPMEQLVTLEETTYPNGAQFTTITLGNGEARWVSESAAEILRISLKTPEVS